MSQNLTKKNLNGMSCCYCYYEKYRCCYCYGLCLMFRVLRCLHCLYAL